MMFALEEVGPDKLKEGVSSKLPLYIWRLSGSHLEHTGKEEFFNIEIHSTENDSFSFNNHFDKLQ